MRVLTVALCAVLAGCSMAMDEISRPPPYVPPSPPSPAAQAKGLQKAITTEKLLGAVQVSEVRIADNGPGRYVICIAGHQKDGSDTGYFAVFFENEDYKDVRPAVMYDFCEKQSYHPMN
jgi:hypothetical protein